MAAAATEVVVVVVVADFVDTLNIFLVADTHAEDASVTARAAFQVAIYAVR